MNIYYREIRLQKYEDMVKAISQEYCKRLNNSFLFEVKLSKLSIEILPTHGLTAGLCKKNANKWHIILAINYSLCDSYNAFVIAHEFAHLLFQKVSDILRVTGRADDNSTELTSITRIASNGKIYGRELEEQCADLLALYIIDKLGYSTEDEFLQSDLNKTKEVRESVEQLIDVYGDDLSTGEYIDNINFDEKGIGHVSNMFWYYAINGSLTELVKSIEGILGFNKFSEICEAFDTKDLAVVGFAKNQISKLHQSYKNI